MKSEYLKSKKFYEIVFICCAFAGIIAWAAGRRLIVMWE